MYMYNSQIHVWDYYRLGGIFFSMIGEQNYGTKRKKGYILRNDVNY